jgi:hypothetical protein
MHAQVLSKLAARGNPVAGTQFTSMYQRAKLVAELHVEGNVAFALKL